MRTGSFFKKLFFFCAFGIFCWGVGYSFYLQRAVKLDLQKTFYFLTAQPQSVQTCVLDVRKDGGAGFLLNSSNQPKVALSVYFQEEEATKAKEANLKKYENLKVTPKTCAKLYLKRDSEKKSAKKIAEGFEGIYTAARFLDETVKMMENGATQNAAKSLLVRLSAYLERLTNAYKGGVSEGFSYVFQNARNSVDKICLNIITVKDLRYLSCQLCADYFDLFSNYSL